MKKKSYILTFTFIIILIGLCSCSNDLNINPHDSLSKNVLSNKKGIKTLLIGAYAALDGQYAGGNSGFPWATAADNWIYGTVAGGIAHKGSDPGDQAPIERIARMESDPSISFLNYKWRADYEGISRANSVLSVLEDTKGLSKQERANIAGQAHFLRGHYYFDLKKMFNHIPWIDQNTTNYNQSNVDNDIWSKIEADFKFAMNNLPETQPQIGKVNKWAAASYLAKTYIFQHKWKEAHQLFLKIIAQGMTSSGIPYALPSKFETMFKASTENNSGAVFAIQFTGHDGSGTVANARMGDILNFPFGGPFGCCGFFQPTQDLVNSYQTDPKTGLPLINSYNDVMVKSDQGINSDHHFTPYQGSLDPRLDWTVGRRGIPYHDWGPFPGKVWVRNQSFAGPYYTLKNIYWHATEGKYFNPNSYGPGTAINVYVIRFAGVLLMAAEADVELGLLDQARQLVNRVRKRAANPNGWVTNALNKAYAAAVVADPSTVTGVDASAGDWVVVTSTKSTYVLLKGNPANINNWQKYPNPAKNYNIELYPSGSPQFQTKSGARKAVHFEEKLEFALEGHRFFDLVRWGVAAKVLNAFYKYEGNLFPDVRGAHFTKGQDEYYPIPQRQIDLSVENGKPVLQQNTGY